MISNTTIRDKKGLTQGKTSICKIVFAWWDKQVNELHGIALNQMLSPPNQIKNT